MKSFKKLRTKHKTQILTFLTLTVLASQSVFGVLVPQKAQAIVAAPTTKISFTFDDGLASTYTQAAPTLSKYGLKGTSYVITGCIGMTRKPNTCRANTDGVYMNWTQVGLLKSVYGWEIGSHTATHPYLASSDASDGQPNVLTPAQVDSELSTSKSVLASHGITATSFSTPYGDYTNATLAQIAKYYASHRGFGDQNNNIFPYNDYLLNTMHVEAGVTVAQVKARIDQAVASKTWLTLSFHDILTKPSTNPDDYQYSTAELDQIASYVKTKQTAGLLTSTLVKDSTVTDSVNLLPNASFNKGIADGWTTDSPSTIKLDTATNGSYPDPKNSVKLTATSQTTHLFSPQVTVNPYTTYILKNFLNVQSLNSGEVGFYIDEYDSSGNWISGQYRVAERSMYVESLNFSYKPSSQLVNKARLQVIISGNSGITAYLDNSQWFTSTSTTPPVATNLVTNGSFEQGLTNGWTTDNPTNVTVDTQNHGSPDNQQTSIKLVAGTAKNAHLFSPSVSVDSTKTYILNSYLNILQRASGDIGFYIDEYDEQGNWVSGQYKTGSATLGAQNIGFFYKPTNANAKKAVLQVIVPTNSGIQAYYDNVIWALQQ